MLKQSKTEYKTRLFETLHKIDENMPEKKGIPFQELPPEDQDLFVRILRFDPKEMRGSHGPEGEGNYLNVRSFKSWDQPEGKEFRRILDSKINTFNQKASHEMKITHVSDWELEPGERYWDASFGFTFYPKEQNVDGPTD